MIQKEDIPAFMVGVMTTLVGIGVARFAFTPLLPELVHQGWFSSSQSAYLGATTLLGYLIGALWAHWLSERLSVRLLIRVCFAGIVLSFILCAQPQSFWWFFIWRLVAGAAGAILMVVGPAVALTAIPDFKRTSIGTLIFTGIGIGAVLSATLVPLLLQVSLSATWLALGGLSLIVWWLWDFNFSRLAINPQKTKSSSENYSQINDVKLLVVLVMAAYALDAIGFIPHTVFWVDYLAREQGLGIHGASFQWGVFGVGAVCGPFLARIMAQRFGWSVALVLAFIVKALAVFLPMSGVNLLVISLSSFMVGVMVPAVVALTSGRIVELVGSVEHKRYWGIATAVFAVAQAISGYGMSALYQYLGSYHELYFIGAATLLTGAGLLTLSGFVHQRKEPGAL